MSESQFDPQQLASTLSDLALRLQHQRSPQETLDAIVSAAVDTVPGAEHAGITMVRRRRELHTVAAPPRWRVRSIAASTPAARDPAWMRCGSSERSA